MLSFIQQPKATVGPSQEELAHTAAMPWLIAHVRETVHFQDILESDACLTSLEECDVDAWDCLESSGVIDPSELLTVREALTYDSGHVCFYPVALLSHENPLSLHLPTPSSSQERARLDEKTLTELSEGRLQVSRHAKQALGSGYTELLPASRGVSLLALMEIELTQGVWLLGWGWTWHRRA